MGVIISGGAGSEMLYFAPMITVQAPRYLVVQYPYVV